MPKRAFVSVGSTVFPQLIKAVFSFETTEALFDLGYRELSVQYGADTQLYLDLHQGHSTKMSITGFDYSPSLEKEMQQADLIISHAGIIFTGLSNSIGSGSVLEALHLGKLLVVVPNASLMDNHQADVAKALSDEGYLLQSSPEYAYFCFLG